MMLDNITYGTNVLNLNLTKLICKPKKIMCVLLYYVNIVVVKVFINYISHGLHKEYSSHGIIIQV